jgi:hypothetical protein
MAELGRWGLGDEDWRKNYYRSRFNYTKSTGNREPYKYEGHKERRICPLMLTVSLGIYIIRPHNRQMGRPSLVKYRHQLWCGRLYDEKYPL